jgi:hypothetical protein
VSPQLVRHTAGKTVDSQSVTETSETSADSQKVTGVPPGPSESAIHGREVHVAKQKQTQKEVSAQILLYSFICSVCLALQSNVWSNVMVQKHARNLLNYLRFEVFMAVTMKNAVFWDVTLCGSSKKQCFGGAYLLCHQLVVTANVVSSSLILFTLMMKVIHSSKISVLTSVTRCHIPKLAFFFSTK